MGSESGQPHGAWSLLDLRRSRNLLGLRAVLDELLEGRPFYLTKEDAPVAIVLPIEEYERLVADASMTRAR